MTIQHTHSFKETNKNALKGGINEQLSVRCLKILKCVQLIVR